MEIGPRSNLPKRTAQPAEAALLPFRGPKSSSEPRKLTDLRQAYWERTCFYASPINDPGSEQREHADLLLESLVKPAIQAVDPDMSVVRADELPTTSITASVVEYVQKSRLVIADLSFHNPNVFYEIGQRDARGKPFVLISRAVDPIPSNLRDSRVIQVNMEKVPAFVSEMEMRQEQISEYARWALSPEGEDYFANHRRGS